MANLWPLQVLVGRSYLIFLSAPSYHPSYHVWEKWLLWCPSTHPLWNFHEDTLTVELVLQLVGCIGAWFTKHYSTVNLISCRFAYAILAADELVAVANTIAFKYDDGRTYINWVVGGEVDAAVWIALFLVIVVCINMLPVRVSFSNPVREFNECR